MPHHSIIQYATYIHLGRTTSKSSMTPASAAATPPQQPPPHISPSCIVIPSPKCRHIPLAATYWAARWGTSRRPCWCDRDAQVSIDVKLNLSIYIEYTTDVTKCAQSIKEQVLSNPSWFQLEILGLLGLQSASDETS